jgi:6-phosphogluconolactonase
MDEAGMKTNKLTLPNQVTLIEAESRQALTQQLADTIAQQLDDAIKARGTASLAVSGGSTPVPLFQALSKKPLDWENVIITLVDDRWVAPDSPDSNEALVRTHLLQNEAAQAPFIPHYQADQPAAASVSTLCKRLSVIDGPITTVILGMGNDGHTASLFPCSSQLELAMNSDRDCEATKPSTAPYSRMTLTPKRLFNSEHRILHMCGDDKLETLSKALEINNPKLMPIALFTQQPLTIYWAP